MALPTPTDQVREAFRGEDDRRMEFLKERIAPDARVHVPDVLPFDDLRGFDGLTTVVGALLERSGNTFEVVYLDVIGGGDIVAVVNSAQAHRGDDHISYNNLWTFRFAGDAIAEVWLTPSVPGTEIVRFFGFGDEG
ncbi:MAG TPA: nuclear transport factor 2 family protein [Acidimicrobiales bacterium]|nr:nuclear transport factor 2 family protein [Acidimicrobiales bacterium]